MTAVEPDLSRDAALRLGRLDVMGPSDSPRRWLVD